MIVRVPGGPYTWRAIMAAALAVEMDHPIDTAALEPGRAYWLPRPNPVTGCVRPLLAEAVSVIQTVYRAIAFDYNELAGLLDMHPCQLVDWMDGIEEPDGPAWDKLLSLLDGDPAPPAHAVLPFRKRG